MNLLKDNLSVLVIDDDDMVLKAAEAMLSTIGCDVTSQKNSLAALELFRIDPDNFDVIITDFSMPGINGIELSQRILSLRPDIPIILCTGCRSEEVTMQQAHAVGIKEFITKPYIKKDIQKAIIKVQKI